MVVMDLFRQLFAPLDEELEPHLPLLVRARKMSTG